MSRPPRQTEASALLTHIWECLEWQRAAEGLTMAEVSARMGRHRHFYERAKRTQRDMQLSTFERIALAMNKKARFYLEDHDHEHGTAHSVVKHPNVRHRDDQRGPFKARVQRRKSFVRQITHQD